MFCKNCGNNLNPDSQYCHRCGKKTDMSETGNTRRSLFNILTTLMIFAILAGSYFLYTKEDLAATVNGQLKALRDNKVSEAYYEYMSKAYQKGTSLDGFKEYLKKNPILSKKPTLESYEQYIDNEQGTLNGKIKETNGELIDIQYKLIKEDNKWKILSIELPPSRGNIAYNEIALAEPTQKLDEAAAATLLPTVQKFIETLQKEKILKDYPPELVSKEFSETTPIDKFRTFTENNPILVHHKNFKVKDASLENNHGSITLILDPDKGNIPINFTLVKQDNSWKIWSMKLLLEEEIKDNKDNFNTQPIKEVIMGQLSALKEHDYKKAYEAFTSKDFRKETSEEEFKNFLKRNPVFLTFKTIKLPKFMVDNNVVTLSGTFVSDDNQEFDIEYDLIEEDNTWKIIGLRINPKSKIENKEKESKKSENDSSAFAFNDIAIGTEIDHDGKVIDPKKHLDKSTNDIYVNIYYLNGEKGTKIDLQLNHLESKSRLEPVSTTLQKNGDSHVTFVFSPPHYGWPSGLYHLNASSSEGDEQSFEFELK